MQGTTTIHVVQHLSPGGLEALALNMLQFSSPTNQVMIVSLEGDKTAAIKQWPRLAQFEKQLVFLNKPLGYSLNTLSKLYKLFVMLKPDVVHTHHIGPILYGSIAARLANVKHRIHTEHDAWHLSNPRHRFLQDLALKLGKPRLVADASLVRDQIKHYFTHQSVTVIKNGIDSASFKPGSKMLARQSLGLSTYPTYIGTAGRLEQVKGHDILINAICFLPNNIHLVIAGDGSQKEALQQQAKDLGLSHRITFLGLVNDMPKFYQSLDLFCLPSRSEGFPLSTLEAQSCGIATVATDVGATKETLCPKTGQLAPAENPQRLSIALRNALSSPCQDSPREFIVKNNDIRNMVQAYEALTEEEYA